MIQFWSCEFALLFWEADSNENLFKVKKSWIGKLMKLYVVANVWSLYRVKRWKYFSNSGSKKMREEIDFGIWFPWVLFSWSNLNSDQKDEIQ